MADWHGIRQALATKCAAIAGINQATADAIEGAPDTPAIFVLNIANLDMTDRGHGYESRDADINALLVLTRSPGLGTATEQADDLMELIDVAFRTGINLGYPAIVQDAYRASASEDSEITIGGVEYIGYRMTFRVRVRENVTRSMS